MNESFVEVLEEFLRARHYSRGQLADLAQLPRETVDSWFKRNSTPRHTEDIIRIAQVLNLSESNANRLFRAARRPEIHGLIEEAQRSKNENLLQLLSIWSKAPRAESSDQPIPMAPFQAPRLDTPFLGRTTEFKQSREWLLTNDRVCVILGMGGVGKSFLAAYIAAQLHPLFPDGVLWARIPDSQPANDLPIADKLMPILGTFAEAYGRDVSQYADLDSRVRIVHEVLAKKRALVVLDNLQSSQELELLLPGTKLCSILITTRYPKSIQGYKTVVHLTPFQAADGLALLGSFVGTERIKDEKIGAQQIIDFVGGLPLALRVIGSTLAAAPYLTIAEYSDMLLIEESSLTHLEDWQDTSKSVRASFELSYRRLDDLSQVLFATLALFDNEDFSVDALCAVTRANPVQVKLQMGRLTSVSLVETVTVSDREFLSSIAPDKAQQSILERYRLHSLLRLFAREKFASDPALMNQRLIDYYIQLTHRYRQQGYRLLDLDWGNIERSLAWLQAHHHWPQVTEMLNNLTFVNLGILGFLDARGYWLKAQYWLEALLRQPTTVVDIQLKAMLHLKVGAFAFRLAQFAQAEENLRLAHELTGQLPATDTTGLIKAYICEFMSQLLSHDDIQQGLQWSNQGIEVIRCTQALLLMPEKGYLSIRHATNLARIGDFSSARKEIQEALIALPNYPTPARISAFITLGRICSLQGESADAQSYWQRGEADAKAIGDNLRLARLWLNLAAQADERGLFTESIKYNRQALELYQRIGDVNGEGLVSSNLAFTYLVQQGEVEVARPYLEAAESLAEKHKLPDVELFAKVNRAHWHLHFQTYDQASILLKEAWALSEKLEELPSQAEILRLQAEIAQYQRDYNNALSLIRQSLEIAKGNPLEEGIGWRVKGNIYTAMRDGEQAETAYQQSIELLADYIFEQARTQVALSRHYTKQNARKEARQTLALAEKTLETLRVTHELAKARALLNQLK